MKPGEITIAEALKTAGYRSACIGKWHNGEQFPYTPQGQGFDEFFGFHNGHWNNYFDTELLRGAKFEKTKGYITDVLTDEAMKFISKNQSAPFFCYLAFNAPHSPYQVPDQYFDRFKAKGFTDELAAYWGMAENIDDNLARLFAHLDKLKLADNTIVIFMTDNGGTAGVKTFNAGMRGGKTSVHEGGTRVPLFVRWPAAKWQPHVVKPLAAHIDIFPTLMDLCGVTPPAGPKVDGRSLRPLLEGREAGWPERVLFTHNPIDEQNKFPGAVRTPTHRLVRELKGAAGGSKARANDASAPAWQLYDMVADPGQATDIAKQNPDLVARLSKLYDDWFADISSEGLQRFPIPVGHAQENPVEIHAPQSYFTGKLHFASGPGFANDWLTGWTEATDKVWFEIDVVRAGTYRVSLGYVCPKESAGSKLRISAGGQSVEATVKDTVIAPIKLPHRDESGHGKYRNQKLATLDVGRLQLPAGRTQLTIEVLSKSGAEVMEFKHVTLERLK
jgi:arylsulfatase A